MLLSIPPGKSKYTRWSGKARAEGVFSLRVAGGGVFRAILLAVVLVLLASTVVYFTHLDERVLQWVVDAGSFAVLGIASFVTARREGKYGLLYGVVIGAGYAVLTLIIGTLLFPPFSGVATFLKRLGFSVLAGACGGILGVNA